MKVAAAARDRVKFNVGGRKFETTATTLAGAGRESFFGPLLDDNWNLRNTQSATAGDDKKGEEEEYFIDRNPDCFAVILDLLRTGDLSLPPAVPERLLHREASFYGVLDLVRAAKRSPFDGNRLRHAKSVAGRAPGDGTAIRAGPDGGCAVAHGSVVHVYDWMMMEEHPPLTLDYQRVNDVVWVDGESIAVSACERLGRDDGGLGLFDKSSGELRFKFRVSHDNKVKSFTGGALSVANSNQRIFCSCKGRSNEYGIGVWDRFTGEQTDFFYEPLGGSLGDADRLQWLDEKSCLLVATLFPRKDNCYISLLDFRSKDIVWSWSDVGDSAKFDEKKVRDAISMEGMNNNALCVVNEYEDLGFMDLRKNGGGNIIRWSSRSKLMKWRMHDAEPCYPKLALHGGQLFASMNDCISVFSGSEMVLTSRLRRSYGGSICDFSIGGDRLFALHGEDNVFDVWECPPRPVV